MRIVFAGHDSRTGQPFLETTVSNSIVKICFSLSILIYVRHDSLNIVFCQNAQVSKICEMNYEQEM